MSAIDRFIPEGDIAECHQTIVHAPADVVLDVAEHYDLRSSFIVDMIFRLRSLLMGAVKTPPRTAQGIVDETTSLGWGVLSRTSGREIVVGAVTRPWVADVTFRAIPADSFVAFDDPGYVKIVWTLEVEPLSDGRTRFRTQTRVLATDDEARRSFRSYWRRAAPGILMIRWLMVPAVRREAERRTRTSALRARPSH